jgi:hypothetical protein
MSIEQDLNTDVQHMDEEWVKISNQFFKYSELSDLKDIQCRKKKLEIEAKEANLSIHIRKNTDKYCKELNVSKLTDSIVSTLIIADPELEILKSQMLNLEKEKKLTISVCKSLELKCEGLKNLTRLWIGEYYAAPTSNSEGKHFLKIQDEVNERNVLKEVKRRFHNRNQETKE